MSAPGYGLLICKNGVTEGLPALEYGTWLAGLLQVPVTLLGIVEEAGRGTEVERVLHEAEAKLDAAGIVHTSQLRAGPAPEVICAEAKPERHLVVIGPLGRPWWERWIRGRALRRMMPYLDTPFIFVSTAHRRLERILLCTGGLEYSVSAECWALHLAQHAGASATILHVAEAVHYHYPIADQVETHWQELLETDIPQTRHLRTLLEQAGSQEVEATIKVRHGTVVHEILAEAREGRYDLVVMGSKHSSHSLRRHYLPDVTAEVMEALELPVLVVRHGQDCILADQPWSTGLGEV